MAGKQALKKQEVIQQEAGVEEIVLGGAVDTLENDLDAMFDDLESGLSDTLTISGLTADEAPTEVHMIEAGHAATTDDLKALALQELDEQSSPVSDLAKMPAPQKKAAPATKRINTAGMAKSEALATALGDKLDDLLTIDSDDLKLSDDDRFDKRLALLEGIDKMPKKIGEKVTNLFAHIAKGAQLSNYTRIALNLLMANGELTSKMLRDTYLSRPYSEGTSSSQCTQLMNLLPALGIVKKEAGKLVLNPTSTLFPLLTSIKSSQTAGVDDEETGE